MNARSRNLRLIAALAALAAALTATSAASARPMPSGGLRPIPPGETLGPLPPIYFSTAA